MDGASPRTVSIPVFGTVEGLPVCDIDVGDSRPTYVGRPKSVCEALVILSKSHADLQ